MQVLTTAAPTASSPDLPSVQIEPECPVFAVYSTAQPLPPVILPETVIAQPEPIQPLSRKIPKDTIVEAVHTIRSAAGQGGTSVQAVWSSWSHELKVSVVKAIHRKLPTLYLYLSNLLLNPDGYLFL